MSCSVMPMTNAPRRPASINPSAWSLVKASRIGPRETPYLSARFSSIRRDPGATSWEMMARRNASAT